MYDISDVRLIVFNLTDEEIDELADSFGFFQESFAVSLPATLI